MDMDALTAEIEALIDARSASFIEGTDEFLSINRRIAEIMDSSCEAFDLACEMQARRFR